MAEIIPFDALYIEKSLSQTGEPVADTVFLRSSDAAVPLIVYTDKQERQGSDQKNLYTIHTITIDRYTLDGQRNSILDQMLDNAGIKFEYVKYYIQADEIVQEQYTLDPIIIRD